MLVKGRVAGLLRLEHSEPGHFAQHHARLALAMANQAGIAIENARLYRAARKVAALEERQRLAPKPFTLSLWERTRPKRSLVRGRFV